MAIYFGHGLVWDKDRKCILCKFVDNKFYTIDENTKRKLDALGYIADRDDEIVVLEDSFDEMNIKELRGYCKEKSYTDYAALSKTKLIGFIRERSK